MALQDLKQLEDRLLRDVRQFADGGNRIIERNDSRLDASSYRTAANQFRQAAMALDQLDGVEQAKHYLDV